MLARLSFADIKQHCWRSLFSAGPQFETEAPRESHYLESWNLPCDDARATDVVDVKVGVDKLDDRFIGDLIHGLDNVVGWESERSSHIRKSHFSLCQLLDQRGWSYLNNQKMTLTPGVFL